MRGYCYFHIGIEHSQIVDTSDFKLFNKKIIPSVQPTHATSDMYWVKDRIGSSRMEGAYSYKRLLKESGSIVLGTDFPVEDVSPILTFYAAISRKDVNGYPEDGFNFENALSREEALRGMTIWAAKANFEEKEKGSKGWSGTALGKRRKIGGGGEGWVDVREGRTNL